MRWIAVAVVVGSLFSCVPRAAAPPTTEPQEQESYEAQLLRQERLRQQQQQQHGSDAAVGGDDGQNDQEVAAITTDNPPAPDDANRQHVADLVNVKTEGDGDTQDECAGAGCGAGSNDDVDIEDGVAVVRAPHPVWCAQSGPRAGVCGDTADRCRTATKARDCKRTDAFACFSMTLRTSSEKLVGCLATYGLCSRYVRAMSNSDEASDVADCVIFRVAKSKKK